MDSELMLSSSMGSQLDMRSYITKMLYDFKFGDSCLRFRSLSGNLLAINHITPNGYIDPSFIFCRCPIHQSFIGPGNGMFLKLGTEHSMGLIGFGHHHDPRCFLVEPMDQAWIRIRLVETIRFSTRLEMF